MIIWGSPVSLIMPTWIGGPVGVKAGGHRRWKFALFSVLFEGVDYCVLPFAQTPAYVCLEWAT